MPGLFLWLYIEVIELGSRGIQRTLSKVRALAPALKMSDFWPNSAPWRAQRAQNFEFDVFLASQVQLPLYKAIETNPASIG